MNICVIVNVCFIHNTHYWLQNKLFIYGFISKYFWLLYQNQGVLCWLGACYHTFEKKKPEAIIKKNGDIFFPHGKTSYKTF